MYKFMNIPSLFTFTHCSIFNIFFAFLEDKRYKKKLHMPGHDTRHKTPGNEKLDKTIKEALEENSNLFLTLAHGNIYSTAFVFSYLKKN